MKEMTLDEIAFGPGGTEANGFASVPQAAPEIVGEGWKPLERPSDPQPFAGQGPQQGSEQFSETMRPLPMYENDPREAPMGLRPGTMQRGFGGAAKDYSMNPENERFAGHPLLATLPEANGMAVAPSPAPTLAPEPNAFNEGESGPAPRDISFSGPWDDEKNGPGMNPPPAVFAEREIVEPLPVARQPGVGDE